MATELDFCNHLLQKLLGFERDGKAPFLRAFLQPVDEVENNAPDYYRTIREPMDMGTMGTKLANGLYADAAAFKADFDQIINNCRIYNHDNEAFVKKYADRLEKEIGWEWEGMGKWLAKERRRARQAGTVPAPTTAPTIATSAPPAAPTITTTAPAPSAVAAATTASINAASASTSGAESSSAERDEASNVEPERHMRTSPSPSLGSPSGHGTATPRPSAFLAAALASNRGRQPAEEGVDDDETSRGSRVNGSSDDAVELVMNAMRAIMAEQIAAVAA